MSEKAVVIESRDYREAQERLLGCPVFLKMLIEIPEETLVNGIENHRMGVNLAIRDEYRARGGQVSVHGLGDYVRAAELYLKAKGEK